MRKNTGRICTNEEKKSKTIGRKIRIYKRKEKKILVSNIKIHKKEEK